MIECIEMSGNILFANDQGWKNLGFGKLF